MGFDSMVCFAALCELTDEGRCAVVVASDLYAYCLDRTTAFYPYRALKRGARLPTNAHCNHRLRGRIACTYAAKYRDIKNPLIFRTTGNVPY